jgi:hypothetical protein
MTRSAWNSIRLGLVAAASFYLPAMAGEPGGMQQDSKTPPAYSMVPSAPGDHFVPGKYDKTGTYIPPHYAPKPKPAFHGYFYKKGTSGYDNLHSDRKHIESGQSDSKQY